MDKSADKGKDATYAVDLGDGVKGFAIHPKTDCPHIQGEWIKETTDLFKTMKEEVLKTPCKECANEQENWLCLVCQTVLCSRYVKGHMASHNKDTKHSVALSFSDASFWCYNCESYITSLGLNYLTALFSDIKHSTDITTNPVDDVDETSEFEEVTQQIRSMDIKDKEISGKNEQKKLSYSDFIKGVKDKQFRKIVVLTGAGISVSCGIPDFRTPGTGLYSQLEKMNLPFPEAVFAISQFKENPLPFYAIAKAFINMKAIPSINHKFIKLLNDNEQLLINMTQNIDGLEVDCGVPLSKVVQAHGHMRSARCIGCTKEGSVEIFKKCVLEESPQKCDCGALIKPDIVFFGENLPMSFFEKIPLFKEGDLVIVMGTSLKVQPFASLIDMVNDDVPIVIVNRENPVSHNKRPNLLFIEGDLDANIQKIINDCGWSIDTHPSNKSKL